MSNENDLLAELVMHPGWKVLRKELQEQLRFYQEDLLVPAEKEFDLVRKEGVTRAMQALKQFVFRVELRAENYARTVRREV